MPNKLILRTQHNGAPIYLRPAINKTRQRSVALKEITSRALSHIQENSGLSTRIQVGNHELCQPDYQLLYDLSQQLKLSTENLLDKLTSYEETELIDGQFRSIFFNKDLFIKHSKLTISSTSLHLNLNHIHLCFTKVKYLKIEIPSLHGLDCGWNKLTDLDLSHAPNLTHLRCMGNRLKHIDLSNTPSLTHLHCDMNYLTELNLSKLFNLSLLHCDINYLTELDLSPVPHLKFLFCNRNKLSKLDFSHQHHITTIIPHTDESTIAPWASQTFDPEEEILHFYCDSRTKIIKLNNQKIQTP